MPERWITPQPDLQLMHPDTEKPVEDATGTVKWAEIMLRMLAHPKLTGSTPVLKSNNLIRRRLKACQVGIPFPVPEEDWKRLADVLNDPDDVGGRERAQGALSQLVRLVPAVLPQLEEVFTAWTDAPTKQPEVKLESVPAAPQLPAEPLPPAVAAVTPPALTE